MIDDLAEFARTGVVCRRAATLHVPVDAWRAAMRHAGRRDAARVRTFLIPPAVADAHDARDQLVFAVRTDPPPDPAVPSQGLLRWWRLDELNMPFARWRTALHRIARRERVRVHTFLAPSARPDHPDRLVYALWIDPADPRQSALAPAATFPPGPCGNAPAVTNLADFAAARAARRSASVARHPSRHDGWGDEDWDDDVRGDEVGRGPLP